MEVYTDGVRNIGECPGYFVICFFRGRRYPASAGHSAGTAGFTSAAHYAASIYDHIGTEKQDRRYYALRALSFSCFLPALQHEYPFIVGDNKEPSECIELINKWKEARLPVRVIITDTPINLMFGIMSFDYKEQDGSRDIYYTLSLTEYKNLNTPMANNDKQVDDTTGLKDRPTNMTQPTTATIWQQGADICDAAKKAYGDYNHWRRIVQSNDLKDLAINNASKLRKLVVK